MGALQMEFISWSCQALITLLTFFYLKERTQGWVSGSTSSNNAILIVLGINKILSEQKTFNYFVS